MMVYSGWGMVADTADAVIVQVPWLAVLLRCVSPGADARPRTNSAGCVRSLVLKAQIKLVSGARMRGAR
jgi:hypothetical protein